MKLSVGDDCSAFLLINNYNGLLYFEFGFHHKMTNCQNNFEFSIKEGSSE
jgi:hypothetical protein